MLGAGRLHAAAAGWLSLVCIALGGRAIRSSSHNHPSMHKLSKPATQVIIPAGLVPVGHQMCRKHAARCPPDICRRPDIAGVAAMMAPQMLQALDSLARVQQGQQQEQQPGLLMQGAGHRASSGGGSGSAAVPLTSNQLLAVPAERLVPVPDPTSRVRGASLSGLTAAAGPR